MNVIEFDVKYLYPKSFSSRPYLEILVDQVPLQDIFSRYALSKGFGIIPLNRPATPRHYFKGYKNWFDESRGRKQVLDCACGCPGCSPVYCRISVGEDVVKWHDFVGGWSRVYDFDGFVFEDMQYMEALEVCQFQFESVLNQAP